MNDFLSPLLAMGLDRLPRLGNKSLLLLVLLIILSYLGNYFYLPLFFGLDFLFGSIFALIVVYFYGTFWGVIASLIGSSYTFFLWGHPYAILLMTGEVLFVGLLLHHRRHSLVLLTGLYWVTFGMILVLSSMVRFYKFPQIKPIWLWLNRWLMPFLTRLLPI
jgi:hypothetical protein